MLAKIRTILVHNSHPGNIGASARALKNMGLSQLYLVAPKEFPSKEAEARASNAQDILANAKVFATLEEALKSCTWVLGASGRQRKLSLPVFSAREAAEEIIKQLNSNQIVSTENPLSDLSHSNLGTQAQVISDVAILYGNEQHGLSNEELDQCAAQIIIPTANEYASLNLAQAVQIMSYELFLASLTSEPTPEMESLPSHEALAEFYRELEKALINIGYLDPEKPGQMIVRLKHMFARAKVNKTELTLLRGMLTAIKNTNANFK